MQKTHACCTVPPVVAKGYQPKGEYITVNGMKTYKTGPSDAKSAILVVYDIFGFFPQTIQGADILAYSDKEHKYQVYMPDFFDGKPIPLEWYPPQDDETKSKIGEFFSTTAAPPKTLERIPKVLKEIEGQSSSISSWGIVGYCWGGKVTNLMSQSGSPFKAAAVAHPAMVDPKDAEGTTIPYLMLASKDEPKEDIEKWQAKIKTEHIVEWFPDQIHGWMSARGDLEDAGVKKQYERGYDMILNFFHNHFHA